MTKKRETKLPLLPSALIRVALNDIQEVQRLKKIYKINMGEWHNGRSNELCELCFAGAVMARTLKASPGQDIMPKEFGIMNGNKLCSLDDFRKGKIKAGMKHWPLYLKVKSNKFFENGTLPEKIPVCAYIGTAKLFRKDMFKVARALEKVGL